MADLADGISLRHFQSRDFSVATKADGSTVTEVDMKIEAELSSWVARQRPTDGFLGEEVGAAGGHQQRWIVDGIDGTASFVAGATTWGTLIALDEQGEVVVGVASSPGFGRRWWAARGEGSWVVDLDPDAGPARRLRRALSPSGLGTSTSYLVPPVEELSGWQLQVAGWVGSNTVPTRPNSHGPLAVAHGRLDLSVHLWGGPWDHAAFVPIVEEAGGAFRDLWGGRRLDTFTAVFGSPPSVTALVADLAEGGLLRESP